MTCSRQDKSAAGWQMLNGKVGKVGEADTMKLASICMQLQLQGIV